MTAIIVPLASGPAALSPPAPAAAPAATRAATTSTGTPSSVAAGFERLLAGELAKAMIATAGLDHGPGQVLAAQLPDVLADAVTAGDGLGLATALEGPGR